MKTQNRSVRLFSPGPTHIPKQVLSAMNHGNIHHRSDAFEQCYLDIQQSFSELLGEKTRTAVFTSSGSGAMEAVVASLFQEDDKVVVIHAGKFGERWRDIALNYKLDIKEFSCPWGKTIDSDQVYDWVKLNAPKAVFIQACETSTGVFHPVFELGKRLKSLDTLFIVDAITALAIYPFSLNTDGIDVLIGCSQKALMCPPGLATVSMNEHAFSKLLDKSRSYYFSIQKEFAHQINGASSFTPAIPLFFGLRQALKMILQEGMRAVYERHQFLQSMTRKYFKMQNLDLLSSDDQASFGLTAVVVDNGFDLTLFFKQLKQDFGIVLVGGQGELKGKIFRMAHMGYCYPEDMSLALSAVDQCLKKQGKHHPNALKNTLKILEDSSFKNPY